MLSKYVDDTSPCFAIAFIIFSLLFFVGAIVLGSAWTKYPDSEEVDWLVPIGIVCCLPLTLVCGIGCVLRSSECLAYYFGHYYYRRWNGQRQNTLGP